MNYNHCVTKIMSPCDDNMFFLSLWHFYTDWAASWLMFLLLPLRGFWESEPSLLADSTPTQQPVSGGQTRGLMSYVKHSDILQMPVLEPCHTLAVIVMGGSGRLNQQAGYLNYFTPLIHRHKYGSTRSASAVRSLTVLHCIISFSTCQTSQHCFIISSLNLHIFPGPSLFLSMLHQHPFTMTFP